MRMQVQGRKRVRVAAGVAVRDGKVLLARRHPKMRWPGLWEFPGGKIEAGESPEGCLVREFREELGVEVSVGEFLGRTEYAYPEFDLELLAYWVEVPRGHGFTLTAHDLTVWAGPPELANYEMPPADLPLLPIIRSVLSVSVAGLVLEGKSIVLRPYSEADVDSLYAAALESVAEIFPWMAWCHPAYAKVESEAWVRYCAEAWAKREEFSFAICDRAGGFLGGAGLNTFDWPNRRGNLGYWVRSGCAGRGVATEAARLVAAFGFRALGLDRLEIVAAVENIASQRVAEKAGAVREGIARKRLHLHGVAVDAAVYSLVR